MKRMRIAGLCLVAVFALTAAFAVSAQAAPEFGQCVAQKKGEYTEGACKTKSAKPKKGHFEWHAGPAPSCISVKKGFYSDPGCTTRDEKKGKYEKAGGPGFTTAGGAATLETPAFGAPVTCASNSSVGSVLTATTATQTITFVGCETSGKKCNSGGAGTGEIVVKNVQNTLKEQLPGIVGISFASETGPTGIFVTFECEGPQIRTKGFVTGVNNGADLNAMATTGGEKFENSTNDEQDLETELSVDGGVTWKGPAPSLQLASGTLTSASPMEIRF